MVMMVVYSRVLWHRRLTRRALLSLYTIIFASLTHNANYTETLEHNSNGKRMQFSITFLGSLVDKKMWSADNDSFWVAHALDQIVMKMRHDSQVCISHVMCIPCLILSWVHPFLARDAYLVSVTYIYSLNVTRETDVKKKSLQKSEPRLVNIRTSWCEFWHLPLLLRSPSERLVVNNLLIPVLTTDRLTLFHLEMCCHFEFTRTDDFLLHILYCKMSLISASLICFFEWFNHHDCHVRRKISSQEPQDNDPGLQSESSRHVRRRSRRESSWKLWCEKIKICSIVICERNNKQFSR